jgi:hypothetical protein
MYQKVDAVLKEGFVGETEREQLDIESKAAGQVMLRPIADGRQIALNTHFTTSNGAFYRKVGYA